MLEVKGVNSAYGRAHILYDLNLSAQRGEVVSCSAATARASPPP